MRYVNYLIPFALLLLLSSCLRSGAPAPELEPGTSSNTLRFAIIGDYGTDTQSEADVADLVNSWNVDFVATVGDNNYSSGEASTIDENIGKYYGQYIKPYRGSYGSGSADINRFWPALGNHDWDSISCSGRDCSGPYMDYFELPNNERYYDVQIGSVHLFMLDSDSEEPDGISRTSRQANWLRDKLAASSAPHKLVLLHHAPYSSSSNHGSNRTLQWPFEAWGATAVFSGHDHHYERLTVGTIPYFVNGAGGRRLYPLGSPLPETEVAYDDDFGAMLMQVDNTQIRYEFFNRRGVLIDSYLQDNGASDGTLSRQIAISNDDAEEGSDGRVYLSSTDLELVSDTELGYIEQTVGMRLSNISIPQGANILDAYLEFTVDEVSTDPSSLQFVGEAADNASTYSSAAANISSRPTTTAQVAWNTVPEWSTVGAKQKSPNLAPIIQEIVNRGGWQSGNALALMVTGTGRRTAESYNGSASDAPKLVVRYDSSTTPPPPPTNTPPSLSSPDTQQNLQGERVSLQLSASDTDGDTLSYSASGLPGGLSISAQSGLISGAATTAGSYNVTASVSDGEASDSVSFGWTITPEDTTITLLAADFSQNSSGFSYRDNAFRESVQGAYAAGSYVSSGGYSGGGLELRLGGLDNASIRAMSGAWRASFTLTDPGEVSLQLRYKLNQAANYESDEFSELLIGLDGRLKGQNGNDYIVQLRGNGNGGSVQSTGWQTVELNLGILAAGNHSLDLGAYNNKKTYNDETTQAWFDDVRVVQTSVTSPPPPTPSTRTVRYSFETSEGFSRNPAGSDRATTGLWGRSNPQQTSTSGATMQLGTAHEGQYALLTDGRTGSSVGSYDVDSGVTSIRSPNIDLRDASAAKLSLAYYFAHLRNSSSADFLKVSIVGNTTATVLKERGAANTDSASWQSASYNLSQFLGQEVYLLIEAADADNPSLVEAGVDSIVITIEE